MADGPSPLPHRQTQTAFGGLQGLRLIWSAGGRWERFFLLCPLWWLGFIVLLLVAFSTQQVDAWMRLLTVAFTFVGLVDTWWTPIASAAVLRATVGTGLNKSDENARYLSEYLESLGQGGHWRGGKGARRRCRAVMFSWGM